MFMWFCAYIQILRTQIFRSIYLKLHQICPRFCLCSVGAVDSWRPWGVKLQNSMTTKKLEKVDLRTKYLVYGYNRKHSPDIPLPICDLCLLYYFQPDSWSKRCIHQGIELRDHTTIKKVRGQTSWCASKNTNAFLADSIEYGIHKRMFKIIEWNQRKSKIDIGICEIKYCHPPLEGYFAQHIQERYAVTFTTNQLKTGDMIQIIIDLDGKTLKSQVNGTDSQSLSFIKKSKYRVYVGIYEIGDAIKFLE